MIPTNPLTKPHVDRFAGFPEPVNAPGEDEVERRVQELMNEWLEFYFSGLEFQTPDSETTTVGKTFIKSTVLWDQSAMPNPLTEPVLHVILANRRDDETQVGKNKWRVNGRWTWNLLVRVPPQLAVEVTVPRVSSEVATVDAGRVCRKLADQCRWLMRSAERQSLAMKGISKLKIDNGPQMMPGGAWHLRQIVFSAEVVHHRLDNMP